MDCEHNHSSEESDGRAPHSPETDSDRLIKDNLGRYCL